MPKHKTPGSGRDFKPGNPGGPGRPKTPEALKNLRIMTEKQVAEVASVILDGNLEELQRILKEKTDSPLKMALASVTAKIIRQGDMSSLNLLLSRIIGHVKERIDLTSADGSMKPKLVVEIVTNESKD